MSAEGMSSSFAPDVSPLIREILWKRGFRSNEEVKAFLYPSLADIPSPIGKLKDLDIAVDLLLKARAKRDPIVIFGDYDVDGATSTVLLYTALQAFGYEVSYFIPHRVDDGYGVTEKAAAKLLVAHPSVKLVITCDCGVASFEGIAKLKANGLKVIVTDHHEVPTERVSADAVLNPKQSDCQYPDKKLAGVGVAFLLIIGLRRALDLKEFSLMPWLDLVAIGTVCDVAELIGVNRIFVRLGLQRLRSTERIGLRALLRQLDLEEKLPKSRDLGFLIGPRINASGRIGEPTLGVRTLLAESEDEANDLVTILENCNRDRRAMQDEQLKQALKMAEERIQKNPKLLTLVIANPNFHLGIVGLLAARIAETYQRPTCVLTELSDEHALVDFGEISEPLWKGSLRTPPGYHLAEALKYLRETHFDLLASGGGHAMAAGVAVFAPNLSLFENEFERAISLQTKIDLPIEMDAELGSTDGLSGALELLEPFGNGNPAPLLLVKGFKVRRVQIMKEIHLKLHGTYRGQDWSVLHFKSPWVRLFSREGQIECDFLAELSENEWMGNKKVELVLKDLIEMRLNGQRLAIRESNEAFQSQGSGQAKSHSHSDSAQS